MKAKLYFLLILFLATINTSLAFQEGQDHKILFEKAVYSMETKADLKEAIILFDSLIRTYPDEREYAANAQFNIGLCYEKLGNAEAQKAYQEVIQHYGDQKEVVQIARERLSLLIFMAEKIVTKPVTPKFTKIKIPTEISWDMHLSPDGKKVSLVSDEKLWILPLYGKLGTDIPGAPLELNTQGVRVEWTAHTWSGDGNWIAFNEYPLKELTKEENKGNQGIYVVSSKGGTPKKVYENYRDARTVNYRISLSSDGKTLAFSDVDLKRNEQHIYTISVDGGVPKQLVDAQAREPVFSPDGKMIAFVEDRHIGRGGGDLWIAPAQGGTPKLVLNAKNASSPIWSPKGDMIAFLDYGNKGNQINFIPIGENGEATGDLITIDAPEGIDGIWLLAGWSPDNKIGAIFERRGETRLYTLPVKGGKAVQVAHGGGQPRWSPDGKRIICVNFSNERSGAWQRLAIASIPAEGGSFMTVPIQTDVKIYIPYFGVGNRVSPDGKMIVFSAKTQKEPPHFLHNHIWTLLVEGGKPNQLTEASEQTTDMFPCWSPDGKAIAFVRARIPKTLTNIKTNIFMVQANGGEPTPLTTESDSVIFGPIEWSPDGKFIAYFSQQNDTSGSGNLSIISANGDGKSRVIGKVKDPHPGMQFAWSPDSKRIAFNGPDGKVIKIISVEDGSIVNIETGLVDSNIGDRLDWSPDGERFVLVGGKGEDKEFWLMEDFLPLEKLASEPEIEAAKEPEGIAIRQVWTGMEADNCGSISSDGKYLSFVDWETGDLAIRDLTTGTSHRLTNEATYEDPNQFAYSSVFSPGGEQVAYAWFNPNLTFELRHLETDNPVPRILYSNNNESVFPAFWLTDGKKLIARRYNSDNKSQIISVNIPDGSVHVLKTLESESQIRLSPSPDNKYLLYDYLTDVNSENYNINLLSLDGTYETCLTEHPATDRLVGSIPGSDKVIFTSNRSGTWDLWAARIENGKVSGLPIRILPEIGQISPLRFTQEGSFYYSIFSRLFSGMITPFNIETGKPGLEESIQSLQGSISRVEWSPDGESLAYVKEHKKLNDYFPQLYILDLKSGEERSFCENLRIHNYIRWSPDGQSILTCGRDENKRGQKNYNGGIYTIDAKTGKLNEILLLPEIKDVVNPIRLATAEWSSDGISIYYLYKDQIVKRNLTTGEEKVIYKGHNLKRILRLSPASNTLLFAYENPETKKIHFCTIPAEGGNAEEIFTSQETDRVRTAVWSPDGNHIFFSESPTLKYSKLWRVAAEGGTPVNICQLPHLDVDLSIHPSRQKIALAYYQQTTEIRVMENLERELEKVYNLSK